MQLGKAGIQEIKSSEGWSSRPYWDIYGKIWTRGYGRTFGITKSSPAITKEQGEKELVVEFDRRYAFALKPFIGMTGFSQNMYDALASFIWNCGTGSVGPTTTVGKHLRAGNWAKAADAMLAWNKSGGAWMKGLADRRERERKLFLKKAPARNRKKLLTAAEERAVDVLVLERKIAKRHGGWKKIDPGHEERAFQAKSWLQKRVRFLDTQNMSIANRVDRVSYMVEIIKAV